MQNFEISEVKRIDSDARALVAADIQSELYEQRGDWEDAWIEPRAKDQLLNWLFDRIDREPGVKCFSAKINGRRGYLFCEYDEDGGIEAIEFQVRRPRIVKA